MLKLLIISFLFFGCVTAGITKEERDLYPICKLSCEREFDGVYGIKFRYIRDDLVRCTCLKPRGDEKLYLIVDHAEVVEGQFEVNSFHYETE